MSLTAVETDFFDYYSTNKYTSELGTVLRGSIKQAVKKISKYRLRVNQRAEVPITGGSTFVLLPTNFAAATITQLYKLKTGMELTNPSLSTTYLDIWSKLSYYLPVVGGRFRADGRVYARRHDDDYGDGEQECVELFETDSGQYALWLDVDSASARTVKEFKYHAIHEITDGPPAKNTLGADYRDVLIDEVMKLALLARARQLASEDKVDQAKEFREHAKEYGKQLATIASLGGAA
jgi:hypothetical protein